MQSYHSCFGWLWVLSRAVTMTTFTAKGQVDDVGLIQKLCLSLGCFMIFHIK